MIRNYENYLSFLNSKLEKFFKSQKPFIFCKKGCSQCCKNAQFPYSLIEIKYLLTGLSQKEKSVQQKVENNIGQIIEKKKKYKGKKFVYDCPFLINNECCVYEYRGIICRTFGLMTRVDDGIKVKAPFCCYKGLNYSNVLNLRKKTISVRKYKKLGVKEEPLGFNIRYGYVTSEDFEKEFNIAFGEKKPLIDWFLF